MLLLKDGSVKYRYEDDAITAEGLATFVGKVSSGEIQPFLKSASIPEPNDKPVKVVVGKNFKEVVLDSAQEVLVKFYAPWIAPWNDIQYILEQPWFMGFKKHPISHDMWEYTDIGDRADGAK